MLSTTYKILSNILLSPLTPNAEETIRDHECGFLCNGSSNAHIFSTRQTAKIKKKRIQRESARGVCRLKEIL